MASDQRRVQTVIWEVCRPPGGGRPAKFRLVTGIGSYAMWQVRSGQRPLVDPWELRLESGGWCYAFYARGPARVKLGRTTDLMRRWRNLETASGVPLQLVTAWWTDAPEWLESRLHHRFRDVRRRGFGEWFDGEIVVALLRKGVPA